MGLERPGTDLRTVWVGLKCGPRKARRNVAVVRVQQNDAQNLLVEKLHIGVGTVD
jgi:hypothetical protein